MWVWWSYSEAYLEPSQTSTMELFLGSKYASATLFICLTDFMSLVSFYIIPPKSIRKPIFFRCFQGVIKETSGIKWVKILIHCWDDNTCAILRYGFVNDRFCSIKVMKLWNRQKLSPGLVLCKNFVKFIGKHLSQSLLLKKVASVRPATFFKRRLWLRCFPLNFTIFFRARFLQNTSRRQFL